MITPYDIARRLGLDANGGLYRADHGISDARRAHPASQPRGPHYGGTSVSDLSAVSRYFLLSGLGIEGTRPGIRPRGRRPNAKTALGNKGEQMNLLAVSRAHREAAIFVYQQHGRLHPKMWVESNEMVCLIEPSSWQACSLTDWQRAEMLSRVMRSMDGLIIGRTDEVYIRDRVAANGSRSQGDNLAELVDVDPAIRTALMIHALDLRNTETFLTMATFDLDNEGLPYWERHEDDRYFEQFAVPLWAAAKMMRRKHPDWALPSYEADEFCEEQHWIVTRLAK